MFIRKNKFDIFQENSGTRAPIIFPVFEYCWWWGVSDHKKTWKIFKYKKERKKWETKLLSWVPKKGMSKI